MAGEFEDNPNTQIGADGERYPTGTAPTVNPQFSAGVLVVHGPYDDDAAAVAAGLTQGEIYMTTGSGAITTAGVLVVVQ